MTKTILKANTGGVGPLPILTTPLNHDMPITSVKVDTTGLRNTSVLLNFTSQINMTVDVNVNLIFTIKKYIDDGSAQTIGSSWVFSSVAEIFEVESFGFQFYDENVNAGKYTYTVQLASNSFIGIAAGLTVTNATLSIIAVGEEKVGMTNCKGMQN